MVLWSNIINYLWDLFTIYQADKAGTFPSMYNNWFADLCLNLIPSLYGTLWGPFTWYDMFSFRGLFYFFYDQFIIFWVSPLNLFNMVERSLSLDWTYGSIEREFWFVDMNRIFIPYELEHDPYDFAYWTTLVNG